MSIQEKIRVFIIDNFLFGEDRGLKDESSFLEGGFIDSTGIMQLVAFLEEEYSVVIEDHELLPENLDSINKVTAFVERKAVLVR
jgi:acyl carrier protein